MIDIALKLICQNFNNNSENLCYMMKLVTENLGIYGAIGGQYIDITQIELLNLKQQKMCLYLLSYIFWWFCTFSLLFYLGSSQFLYHNFLKFHEGHLQVDGIPLTDWLQVYL